MLILISSYGLPIDSFWSVPVGYHFFAFKKVDNTYFKKLPLICMMGIGTQSILAFIDIGKVSTEWMLWDSITLSDRKFCKFSRADIHSTVNCLQWKIQKYKWKVTWEVTPVECEDGGRKNRSNLAFFNWIWQLKDSCWELDKQKLHLSWAGPLMNSWCWK